jgi:hypothetical protein
MQVLELPGIQDDIKKIIGEEQRKFQAKLEKKIYKLVKQRLGGDVKRKKKRSVPVPLSSSAPSYFVPSTSFGTFNNSDNKNFGT